MGGELGKRLSVPLCVVKGEGPAFVRSFSVFVSTFNFDGFVVFLFLLFIVLFFCEMIIDFYLFSCFLMRCLLDCAVPGWGGRRFDEGVFERAISGLGWTTD